MNWIVWKFQIFFINFFNYCLVRAYLKFRGIDFEDVEINAFTKKELKEACPGYTQVPVIEIRDHNGKKEAGK